MLREYPWYELVEGEEIEQGDLLLNCPIIQPAGEKLRLPLPQDVKEIDIQINYSDVIIITHSCDLINDKVEEVLLCPHWDLQAASDMDPSLGSRNRQKQILKGQIYRYALLAASDVPEYPMGIRIVDFGRVFTLPKTFVRQLAKSQGKRLRLCPPYREYIAQAFARFFMRVGLPKDIELP